MRLAIAVFCAAVGVSGAAAEDKLSGDALRAALSGKTLHLQTPVGPLPILYVSNGTLRGRALTLASYLGGSQEDQGKWWIANDRICQRWNTWLDSATHCYSFSREGDVVRWKRDDSRSGTARIVSP